MQFKLYTNERDFYKDTYDVLLRHEGQNMIPLGNIIMAKAGKDKTDWPGAEGIQRGANDL